MKLYSYSYCVTFANGKEISGKSNCLFAFDNPPSTKETKAKIDDDTNISWKRICWNKGLQISKGTFGRFNITFANGAIFWKNADLTSDVIIRESFTEYNKRITVSELMDKMDVNDFVKYMKDLMAK